MKTRLLLTLALLCPHSIYAEQTGGTDPNQIPIETAQQNSEQTEDASTEAEPLVFDSLEKQASYAFGVNVATRIKASEITFESESLAQGFLDAISGNPLKLPPQQMQAAYAEFMTQVKTKQETEEQARAEENLATEKLFLEENGKREGVITTESGLQYKILSPGKGARPFEDDTVVVHYRGTLMNGREFDSSYKRNKPAVFPVRGVIPGWTEALQMMRVGGKWQLFIPSRLAYGDQQRSELIEPNSLLIFEVELIEIKK